MTPFPGLVVPTRALRAPRPKSPRSTISRRRGASPSARCGRSCGPTTSLSGFAVSSIRRSAPRRRPSLCRRRRRRRLPVLVPVPDLVLVPAQTLGGRAGASRLTLALPTPAIRRPHDPRPRSLRVLARSPTSARPRSRMRTCPRRLHVQSQCDVSGYPTAPRRRRSSTAKLRGRSTGS